MVNVAACHGRVLQREGVRRVAAIATQPHHGLRSNLNHSEHWSFANALAAPTQKTVTCGGEEQERSMADGPGTVALNPYDSYSPSCEAARYRVRAMRRKLQRLSPSKVTFERFRCKRRQSSCLQANVETGEGSAEGSAEGSVEGVVPSEEAKGNVPFLQCLLDIRDQHNAAYWKGGRNDEASLAESVVTSTDATPPHEDAPGVLEVERRVRAMEDAIATQKRHREELLKLLRAVREKQHTSQRKCG